MKKTILLILIALFPNILFAQNDTIEIYYNHAGLSKIEIKNNKLVYIKHTLRKDLRAILQSLESYDKHETHISLTNEERTAIEEWIKNYNIFKMPSEYPVKEKTYGSAFISNLTIKVNENNHSISWTGDSDTPEELKNAITDLVNISESIFKDRLK